jgi:hypothetical protein
MSEKLEELKQEAKDLGITFSANIGETKLAEKIEAYYESQETSGKEIQEAVEKNEAEEKSEEKSAVSGNPKANRIAKAKTAEEKARKTKVVTIIDNDQRVNNQTTVATVNCSNMYFDLGTMHIPLNIPVEVRQGHLNSLKELKIPLHVKDPKTGLHKTTLRPRYTISYEDMKGDDA